MIAVCPALKIVRDTDPRISVGTWAAVGSLGTYPGMGWYVFSKSREFWTATCAAMHMRLRLRDEHSTRLEGCHILPEIIWVRQVGN